MVDLVSRFKNGDEKSLEYLYDNYSGALVCFVKSYVVDEAKSKDIVQESFISLWNVRGSIDDNSNLKSLLYTICKNRSLNILRDEKKRRNSIEIDSIINSNILSLSHIDTDLMEMNDIERLINHLIDTLPEIYKDVFIKNREENKTYAQISSELNISQKAVEKRMSKVLSILRDGIREDIYTFFVFVLFFSLNR